MKGRGLFTHRRGKISLEEMLTGKGRACARHIPEGDPSAGCFQLASEVLSAEVEGGEGGGGDVRETGSEQGTEQCSMVGCQVGRAYLVLPARVSTAFRGDRPSVLTTH